MKKRHQEIKDYDDQDTTNWINRSKPLALEDLDFKLPPLAPTQVVSIRLPTTLLNKLKALASANDVPYQALIKILLARSIKKTVAI